MKRIVLGTLASICLLSNVYAYDNYIKTAIFYTVPNNLETNNINASTIDINSGYALDFALGQKISSDLDLEIQYTFDKANPTNQKPNIKVHSFFVNTIYNINVESKNIHPYLGFGLGFTDYNRGSSNSTTFSYQGFLGTSFDIDYNLESYIEYKYKNFMDVELDNVEYNNVSIHAIGLGLKSKF